MGHRRLQHLSKSILRSALQTRGARQVCRRQVVEEVGEPAVRQMQGRLRLFQGAEVRRQHPRRLGKGHGLGHEATVVEVDVVGGALQQPLDRIALFVLLLEPLRRRLAYRPHQRAVRPPQAAQEPLDLLYGRRRLLRHNRYSNGSLPAKPVSNSCHQRISGSPSFQQRYTSRPSRSLRKSTSPSSMSFTSHPRSCTRWIKPLTSAAALASSCRVSLSSFSTTCPLEDTW